MAGIFAGFFAGIPRGIPGGIFPSDATPVLPDGAIGVWYATDYAASPPHIPNSVSPASPARLINASRRLFANAQLWYGSSATLTDDVATDINGFTQASTLVGTGNWYMAHATLDSWPAGTYTLAVSIKRNTGSDQSFALSIDGVGTRIAKGPATSSWQRFSHTFTKGSSWSPFQMCICSSDGATDANLQIDYFDVFSGSSDLGPEEQAGTLVLGQTAYSAQPTYSSGELNLSSDGWGLIQFYEDLALTEFTAFALVSKVAAAGTYQSVFSKVKNYTHMSLMTDQSNAAPSVYLGGGGQMGFPGFWQLLNNGYHVIAIRGDASSRSLWLDGMPVHPIAGGMGSVTIRDMWVGIVNTLGLFSGCKLQQLGFYDTALDDAGMAQLFSAVEASATIAPAVIEQLHFAEGDSIIASNGSHAYLAQDDQASTVMGAMLGQSGSSLASMSSRGAAADAIVAARRSVDQVFVLTVYIGANDLAGYIGGVSQYLTDLAAYCDARRAAGFKVAVSTILPIQPGVEHNIRRATFNTTVTTTWVGVHCDAVIDVASNATMGPDAAASNATLYPDGTHPSSTGYSHLTSYYTASLNSLW